MQKGCRWQAFCILLWTVKIFVDIIMLENLEKNIRGDGMNEKEMINNLIDVYTNLQRINLADDTKKEIDNQIRTVKVKLEAFGIITSDLTINK